MVDVQNNCECYILRRVISLYNGLRIAEQILTKVLCSFSFYFVNSKNPTVFMGYVTSKPGSRDYKKFTTYGKLKVGHIPCYFSYSIMIQQKETYRNSNCLREYCTLNQKLAWFVKKSLITMYTGHIIEYKVSSRHDQSFEKLDNQFTHFFLEFFTNH